MGSAISLLSCDRGRNVEPANEENLISRTVDSMEIVSSDNGKKTNLFRAPLMEDHAFAKAAFQEYRHGIEVIGYDSLEAPSSHVVADYALHWIDRDLWELKGNVLVVGENGRRLTTQQLTWDRKIEKIYSNVDSKVEEGEDVFIGEGFEADDDFSRWTFRKLKGRVGVETEAAATPATDSIPIATQPRPATGTATPAPTPIKPNSGTKPTSQRPRP